MACISRCRENGDKVLQAKNKIKTKDCKAGVFFVLFSLLYKKYSMYKISMVPQILFGKEKMIKKKYWKHIELYVMYHD